MLVICMPINVLLAQSGYKSYSLKKSVLITHVDMDSIFFIADTTNLYSMHPGYILLDSVQDVCKQKNYVYGKLSNYAFATGQASHMRSQNLNDVQPTPFLTIHGNIMYEGFYQSNIDTPFVERNIYQHAITTALDITVKDKYPLRLYFTSRFSNTSLLRNFTDANFLFNNRDFKSKVTSNIQQWEMSHLPLSDSINKLEKLLNINKSEFNSLNNWFSSSATLQHLVEEKEKIWLKQQMKEIVTADSLNNNALLKQADSLAGSAKSVIKIKHFDRDELTALLKTKAGLNTKGGYDTFLQKNKQQKIDSTQQSFTQKYTKNKQRLDSLRHTIDSLQKKIALFKGKLNKQIDSINNTFRYVRSTKEITNVIRNGQVPDSVLPKGYKTLMALNSLGIGRSNVNFSELSIKNISVNGLVAEYNPSAYFAVAAGTIDYRFRDYVVQQSPIQKQYVTAVRFGSGQRDGNHVFITYFAGRKQVYNYSTDSGSVARGNPSYNLIGWSIEGRYQLNKYSYIVAEAAKSSLPFYDRQLNKQGLLSSAFNFNQRSNEAYSLNVVSYIPYTATKINAVYKRLGANFQSFSMFTTSSAQTAWALQVSQPFFKNTLQVNASVKKNDFTNPYINQSFYTNTIFKSLQVTVRKKKLPVLSAGYFPSSQLTKLGNNQFIENLFYTVVVTGSHFYKYHSLMMSTVVSYTQFFNKAVDSNFVYFNTRNILVGQSFLLKKATLQFNASAAKNSGYSLYSIDGGIQYNMLRWFTVGGSVKYNRQTVFNNTQIGYGANATIKISKLGDIQFLMQKSYIPGANRQLVENNIGRLIYYKTF